MSEVKPIIVAISGASGTIYGLRLLEFLLQNNYRVELIVSESAIKVAKNEVSLSLSVEPEILKEQVLSYLSLNKSENLNVWAFDDIASSIASGSYKTLGMIIIPASMGTVASISSGLSTNLITRAADVCLKERRKIVIVPREMPFSSIHLENLLKLSKAGAVIAPGCPGFYHHPKELNDAIDFVVGKVLDIFEVEHNLFKRWKKVQLYESYFFYR